MIFNDDSLNTPVINRLCGDSYLLGNVGDLDTIRVTWLDNALEGLHLVGFWRSSFDLVGQVLALSARRRIVDLEEGHNIVLVRLVHGALARSRRVKVEHGWRLQAHKLLEVILLRHHISNQDIINKL